MSYEKNRVAQFGKKLDLAKDTIYPLEDQHLVSS